MRTHSFSSRLQGCSTWAWLVLLLPTHAALAQAPAPAAATGLGSDAQPVWLDRELPEHHEAESWYGWQTLTTDGLALTGLVVAGTLSDSDHQSAPQIAGLTSLSTYMLGAPIIHAVHGNWGAAAGSLGLRTLPLGSSFALSTACGGVFQQNDGCAAAIGAIALVTFMLPIALDPAIFAYEETPEKHASQFHVAAWFEREGGGITVGDMF